MKPTPLVNHFSCPTKWCRVLKPWKHTDGFRTQGWETPNLFSSKQLNFYNFPIKKKEIIRTLNWNPPSSLPFRSVWSGPNRPAQLPPPPVETRPHVHKEPQTCNATRTLLGKKNPKTSGTRTMPTSALQLFHVHFQKGKVTSLGSCITAGTGPSICMWTQVTSYSSRP